jgi:hypothetical protein
MSPKHQYIKEKEAVSAQLSAVSETGVAERRKLNADRLLLCQDGAAG